MKRCRNTVISILVVVFMLTLSLTMYAEDMAISVTQNIGSLTAGAELKLSFTASERLYGATANLVYDESVLELVEISSDVQSFKGTISNEGKKVAYWYNDSDISSKKMFTLHFELKSKIDNVNQLDVKLVNIQATSLDYKTIYCQDVEWSYTICRNHVWEVVSETTATCTANGVRKAKCSICGEKKADEILENALGHDYVPTVVDPTCTNEGYTQHKCSRCTSSYKTDKVAALEHKYEKTGSTTTCNQLGSTGYKCSVCNSVYEVADTQLLDHNFEVQTTPSTCISYGKDVNTCKDCGFVRVDDHKELGNHSYVEKVTSPTCTEAGESLFTCSVCKHAYIDNKTSATGHNFSEWKIEIEPTKEREGIAKRTCEACNHSETQKMEKLLSSETQNPSDIQQEESNESWMLILIIILIIGIVVLLALLIVTYLTFQKKREARKKV